MMIDLKKYSNITKCQKNYKKLNYKVNEAQIEFENILNKNNCYSCDCYFEEKEKPLKERYLSCKSCKNSSKILKAHKNAVSSLEEFEDFIQNEYAKNIFEVLSKLKPDLLIRKTGETITWDEVYDSKFSNLDKSQRKSLVAMIEESGGRYRIR